MKNTEQVSTQLLQIRVQGRRFSRRSEIFFGFLGLSFGMVMLAGCGDESDPLVQEAVQQFDFGFYCEEWLVSPLNEERDVSSAILINMWEINDPTRATSYEEWRNVAGYTDDSFVDVARKYLTLACKR